MEFVARHTDALGTGNNLEIPRAPVVIVGAGPVGIRVARELRNLEPDLPIVVYGEEEYDPYNRVQLSGLLSGQHKVSDLSLAGDLLQQRDPNTEFRPSRVVRLDRSSRTVLDINGVEQVYSNLVLATGSRPFVPALAGAQLSGIYTFRDMADAEKLAARRVQSKHTVVLGAGLLGVEAARGMQRHNTRVTLVDHNLHPMFRQLDETAGEILGGELSARGIELVVGNSIRMLLGTSRVEGVILRNGRQIDCDTLVLATGIRPNHELAKQSGLAFGRGITVDAHMRTSDPDIFAVGECCELDGEVFGLVAPGYEQAAIAARKITGEPDSPVYRRTQLATSLKVAGLSVFSMGEAHPHPSTRTVSWREGDRYRRLTLVAGRIIGINAMGDWAELPRLRSLAQERQWIAPWRIWRFQRTGSLLRDEATNSVALWPAPTMVCNCNSVSVGELRSAITAGSNTLETLCAHTQAGTSCGSCKPLLQELVGDTRPAEPVQGARPLAALTVPALVITVLALIFSFPYPSSVQAAWDWGQLWRLENLKQISGYSILGLCVAGILLSLRKRVAAVRFGDFAWWRLAHVAITVLALVALGIHTGFRFGGQLNMWLSLTFIALLIAGALLGIAIAWEHKLSPARARRLRSIGLWGHVILSWPLPALLGAHVLKTYYF